MTIAFGAEEFQVFIPISDGREMIERYQNCVEQSAPLGYIVEKDDLIAMLNTPGMEKMVVFFAKNKLNRLTIVLQALDANENSITGDNQMYNRYSECCRPPAPLAVTNMNDAIQIEQQRKNDCLDKHFPNKYLV